jgi:hypothetical protein
LGGDNGAEVGGSIEGNEESRKETFSGEGEESRFEKGSEAHGEPRGSETNGGCSAQTLGGGKEGDEERRQEGSAGKGGENGSRSGDS